MMFTDVFSLPIRNHFERLRPVRGFLLCIGFQHTSQTSWNKCFGSLVLSNVITCLTVRSVGAECNAFYKSLFIKVFIQNLFWSDFLGDIVEKAVLKWPLPNHRYCAFNIKIIGKVVFFFCHSASAVSSCFNNGMYCVRGRLSYLEGKHALSA